MADDWVSDCGSARSGRSAGSILAAGSPCGAWIAAKSHAGLHSATVLGKKGTYENNHKNLTCTALNPNAR